MENLKTSKQINLDADVKPIYNPLQAFEVVIIDDNKLVNMILSKALDSTISRIRNLKKVPMKFSSFKSGKEFLEYLKKKDFGNTKVIVFSDYYLEENVKGAEILQCVKEKGIDASVIIMSDTYNKETTVDTVKNGAHCFLPKDKETPKMCSEILSQMVI